MERSPRPITGTHLFQRERCARMVWLEFHGDAEKKLPPDASMAHRMALGRAHETAIVAKLETVEPRYARADFEAGARATEALLRDGAPLVYQGVVAGPGRVGKPDLLRRVEGSSKLGARYVVGDVKLSSAPKVEHAMQVAFYSELLAKTQGERSSHAFLILSDGREAEVSLDEVEPLYRDALGEVEAIREGRREPKPFFGLHCGGCAWRGVCGPELESRGDLSLVFGITPARRDALAATGVGSMQDLAACDPVSVSEKTELPRETVRRLRLQAIALLEREPRPLGPLSWRPARIAYAAAVERDPRSLHFTRFVAYRTASAGGVFDERWICEDAATPAEECNAYRRFVHALASDVDAPVYHYGEAFADALSELDARHGRVGDPIGDVFARLFDVQAGVRSAFVLPVRTYDLASVSSALGVENGSAVGPADDDGAADAHRAKRRLAEEVLAVRRVRLAAARLEKGAAAVSPRP